VPAEVRDQHRQLGPALADATATDIQPVDLREFPPLHSWRIRPAVVLQEGLDFLPATEVHDEYRVVDISTQQRGPGPAEVVRRDVRPHLVVFGQLAGHVVQIPLDPAR